MKRLLCIALAAVIIVGTMLAGCTPLYDKRPDDYSGIRWITPDYSFRIEPENDCKGKYYYNDKGYEIQAEFATNMVRVICTSDGNKQLFTANWMYEDDNLYIYDISYNTADFKELEDNHNEFYTLRPEELKK